MKYKLKSLFNIHTPLALTPKRLFFVFIVVIFLGFNVDTAKANWLTNPIGDAYESLGEKFLGKEATENNDYTECIKAKGSYQDAKCKYINGQHTDSRNAFETTIQGMPSSALEIAGGWFIDGIKALLNGMINLLGFFINVAAGAMKVVLDPANISGPTGILNNPAIFASWAMVRDLLNLGFIFVLLFSAFATIFQVQKYHIKNFFFTVVLMAVLVNFSLPIARFIIDIANIIMYYFLTVIFPPGTSGDAIIVGLLNNSGYSAVITDARSEPSISYLLLLVIVSAIFAFTLLTLAGIFFVRLIALAILLILSPIGFVGSIFPSTASYANKWWDQLLKQAFVGPFIIIMLVITLNFTAQIKNNTSLAFTESGAGGTGATGGTLVANVAYLFIPIIMLIFTMRMAQSMGAAGASFVMNTAHSGRKKLQGVAWKGTKYIARNNPVTNSFIEAGRATKRVTLSKYSPIGQIVNRYTALSRKTDERNKKVEKDFQNRKDLHIAKYQSEGLFTKDSWNKKYGKAIGALTMNPEIEEKVTQWVSGDKAALTDAQNKQQNEIRKGHTDGHSRTADIVGAGKNASSANEIAGHISALNAATDNKTLGLRADQVQALIDAINASKDSEEEKTKALQDLGQYIASSDATKKNLAKEKDNKAYNKLSTALPSVPEINEHSSDKDKYNYHIKNSIMGGIDKTMAEEGQIMAIAKRNTNSQTNGIPPIIDIAQYNKLMNDMNMNDNNVDRARLRRLAEDFFIHPEKYQNKQDEKTISAIHDFKQMLDLYTQQRLSGDPNTTGTASTDLMSVNNEFFFDVKQNKKPDILTPKIVEIIKRVALENIAKDKELLAILTDSNKAGYVEIKAALQTKYNATGTNSESRNKFMQELSNNNDQATVAKILQALEKNQPPP